MLSTGMGKTTTVKNLFMHKRNDRECGTPFIHFKYLAIRAVLDL